MQLQNINNTTQMYLCLDILYDTWLQLSFEKESTIWPVSTFLFNLYLYMYNFFFINSIALKLI